MKNKANMAVFLCKVAGVTFVNDDGESRQSIIKNIIETKGNNNIWSGPGRLNVTTYTSEGKTEPAIEVHVDGKLIGYIPKVKIQEVAEHKRTQSGSVLVQLSYMPQHDTCSAKVFAPNRISPTKNMEYAVNKILRENPKLKKPEKTFDAYRQFLNDYRGGVVDQTKHKVRTI